MFANKQEKCASSQEGKDGTVEDSRCEKQTAGVDPLGVNGPSSRSFPFGFIPIGSNNWKLQATPY